MTRAKTRKVSVHDLHTFMAQVTDEVASEYNRIHSKASQDPGTAGDEGESNWARIFEEWLPSTYSVATKGRIISSDGRLSPQVDVVVLKPGYPSKLLEKKTWLASGVAAAFECKTTIRSKDIKEAVRKCIEVKSLYQPRIGTPRRELRSSLIYGLLAHSHNWKSNRSDPVNRIADALESSRENLSHPRFEIDFVCVADVGTWNLSHVAAYRILPNFEHGDALRATFKGPTGPMTSHVCCAYNSNRQSDDFRPLGSLLAFLMRALAWNDPSIRDIADYFRLVSGNGMGRMHPWPLSVYSDSVRERILSGHLTNGILWDEWTIGDV